MDPSVRQRGGQRKRGGMRAQKIQPPNPQLFDDTSAHPPTAYSLPPHVPDVPLDVQPQPPTSNYMYNTGGMNFEQQQPGYEQNPPQQGSFGYGGQAPFMQDPMANMAVQYGQTLAGQGKDYVHKNLEKYVSTSKLKYYFAVDTTYVCKKLGLLIFPFAHTDWSIKYNQDEPVAPRYEINAPDLYIPVMAFVTYILLSGVMLGTQDRFSPEQLGMIASTALVWIIIEILVLLLSMYIVNVSTDLKYYDLLSYCGYKYVGMILAMLGGMFFQSTGYYALLLWTSLAIAFFLIRALKFAITPHADPDSYSRGNKRRLYMLFLIALSQPVFMWWLTRHLVAA